MRNEKDLTSDELKGILLRVFVRRMRGALLLNLIGMELVVRLKN